MNDDSIKLNEHGLALLALQLRDSGDAVEAASLADDELVALYEGDLNDAERARVLRCIAGDKDIYRRWLSLVEANHTVDSSFALLAGQTSAGEQHVEASAASDAATTKPATWFGLKEKFREWSKSLSYSGAALAAAVMVLVLVSPDTADYQKQLDRLYLDYGYQSSELLRGADALPSRSAGQGPQATQTQRYTAVETLLAKGMLAGLQTLGNDVSVPGVVIDTQKYTNQAQIPEVDRDALASLGRLVALTYFRCQHSGQENFYRQAAPIFAQLNQQLSSAHYDELKIMNVMREQQAGPETKERKKAVSQAQMCAVTTHLTNRFRG